MPRYLILPETEFTNILHEHILKEIVSKLYLNYQWQLQSVTPDCLSCYLSWLKR